MDTEEGVLPCLRLRLNNNDILVLLHQIQIVLPIAELDSMPSIDPAFVGLLDLHSETIPVYHLADLIGEPRPSYDLNTPLLICDLANQPSVGLLVSDVLEVKSIDSTKIYPANAIQSLPYIVGTWEENNHSICLLDLEKLLTCHKHNLEKNNEHLIQSS